MGFFSHYLRYTKNQKKYGKEAPLMVSSSPYTHHTIARAYAAITQGEDPWFALGSFLRDWWCYAKDAREALIAEPTAIGTTLEEKH